MNRKDIIKNILCAGFLACILICSVCFGIFVLQTEYGLVLSIVLGLVLVFLIFWFCYPIWFKDYINEFWKEHESKNM